MKGDIDQLQPAHLVADPGGANREFPCVCLGAFDDGQLWAKLTDKFRKWGEAVGNFAKKIKFGDASEGELKRSVRTITEEWRLHSELTDDSLHLILWFRLQQALVVSPGVTRSIQGCERWTDEPVASALVAPAPSRSNTQRGRETSAKAGRDLKTIVPTERFLIERKSSNLSTPVGEGPKTLANLAAPLLESMVQRALGKGRGGMPEEDRKPEIEETLPQLTEEQDKRSSTKLARTVLTGR